MGHTTRSHEHPACAPLSAAQAAALLDNARALQRAEGNGDRPLPLRGKNLGLWCDDDRERSAALFRRAASELGAHVAHIRPNLGEASSLHELHDTARMLGRLYDAVECQGLPAALVERLAAEAEVPVFDGIALPQHPTALLAGQLDGDSEADDRRCWLLQAALVAAGGGEAERAAQPAGLLASSKAATALAADIIDGPPPM